MNERIRECWIKAAREDAGETWDSQEQFIERFAKSIVKETIHQLGSQLWHYGIDESNNPSFYKAIEKTEEHFGIVNELRLD